MSLDEWQAASVVLGTIAAGCASVVGLVAVTRMAGKAIRRMFGVVKKAGQFFDEVLGDKETNRPSMMDLLQDNSTRLEAIERRQAEHEERFHGIRPNGPVPVVPTLKGRRTR